MNREDLIARVEADERWDAGELGRDIAHAKAADLPQAAADAIDAAANLQMISIRLSVKLIDDFKFIADAQGLRYQTLMRQVLARFADCVTKQMARQAASDQRAMIKEEEADMDRRTG